MADLAEGAEMIVFEILGKTCLYQKLCPSSL